MLVLALLAAVAAGLTWKAKSDALRGRALKPHPTPYRLTSSVLELIAAPEEASQPSRPVSRALMFVSETCRHCRAELERWASVAIAYPQLFSEIEVVVITAVPLNRKGIVPAALPHRHIYDKEGAIAAAVNVRVVPLVAFVSANGIVERVAVGQNSASQVVTWLANLNGDRN